MKTTIDIADPLLRRAQRLAARRNTTLRAIVEQALRETLEREARPKTKVRLRIHTFRGKGLQKGLSWGAWSAIRDLAYEGRGA
jgi:hypothetical protein